MAPLTADDSLASRDALRGGVVFAVLWLMSLSGLATLYLEFRSSNVVEIFGRAYNGFDAVVAMGVLAILPITMLALAIRNFYRYFQAGRRLAS